VDVRRVVTGHDAQGRSRVVSDSRVSPTTVAAFPGYEFHTLWGGDLASEFPDDGSEPQWVGYFPPQCGFRFGVFTIPPKQEGAAIGAGRDVFREVEEKLPGLLKYSERDGSGMHTTPTVDFEIVLQGEVILELDDGQRVTLSAGDTVIQNGTRHRWLNETDAVASYAVCLVGAEHTGIE
jgi:mannose-6-phosphate isomerase-like protein (cupin superfamily)